MAKQQSKLKIIITTLVVFVLAICFMSYLVEKNRMEKMVTELKEILGAFSRET